MSSWEGANVESRRRESLEKRGSSETVEAALSRLSKAYSAAMQCVGAWHRADQQEGASEKEDVGPSLRHVGRAARKTFERAILVDPLIVEHAPALSRLQTDFAQQNKEGWEFCLQKRSDPPTLTSKAHKSTVRQLAYLSLVNYADLLIAGCSCTAHPTHTILDRGVVPPLQTFSTPPHCCWNQTTEETNNETMEIDAEIVQEGQEDTVRLALVSLMDAAALDGSDPTLWLKLASAARRLGRIRDNDNVDSALLQYRRLEKHALEQARLALPPSVPPNRMVLRALQEWKQEEENLKVYPAILAQPSRSDPIIVTLDIPRYSWSVVGRILMRACREGSSYTATHHARHQLSDRPFFGSPLVHLHMSNMLALPLTVLGRICEYLEPQSIYRFEATCRALSNSIIAARAAMDHSQTVRRESMASKPPSEPTLPPSTELPREESIGPSDAERKEETDEGPEEQDRGGNQAASRVSKRLRSQIITSGKRAERSTRRSSVEYCLLAATLGCTPDDKEYQRAVKENLDASAVESSEKHGSPMLPLQKTSMDKSNRYKEEARERVSQSSLMSFVTHWKSRSATPLDVLFGFVAHASLNVGDVFSSDPGGAMVLSSCLMECFDLMTRRTRSSRALIPSWSASDMVVPRGSLLRSLEVFAIDLLHMELRLKRCDRLEHLDLGFDGDCHAVSSMVPFLLSRMEELDGEAADRIADDPAWCRLKARCYWLVAAFYIWRGRLCHNVSESREAEKEGLNYVGEAIKCLGKPSGCPITKLEIPHLESPGRTGPYWKELSVESLAAFRDEIQASSIVLLAQERFLEASSKICAKEGNNTLQDEDRQALYGIGQVLLERYDEPVGSPQAKYAELVDDFLSMCGDKLISASSGPVESLAEAQQTWFDTLVPTRCVEKHALHEMSNPSILSILAVCLLAKEEKRVALLQLFARLVNAIEELSREKSETLASSTRLRSDAESSSDEFSDDDASMHTGDSQRKSSDTTGKDGHIVLLHYGRLMKFLIDKMCHIFEQCLTDEEKTCFAQSGDCRQMIEAGLAFSADWAKVWLFDLGGESDGGEDLNVFQSIQSFFSSIHDFVGTNEENKEALTRVYFEGLVRVIASQRQALTVLSKEKAGGQGRSRRQEAMTRRAHILAVVCFDAGTIFSRYPAQVRTGYIKPSRLFGETERDSSQLSKMVTSLCRDLLWLWRSTSKSDQMPTGGDSGSIESSSRERLRVPTALAIIGLCGSAVSTSNRKNPAATTLEDSDRICLTEFFDSDDSANEWISDDGEEPVHGDGRKHEDELRVIAQAAHCIYHVFGAVEEDEAMSYKYLDGYITDHGPLLPLIVSRVVNTFVDRLLVDFAPEDMSDNESRSIWSEYPFGTRSTGFLFDSILSKAYKLLHGFSLVNMSGEGKEAAGNANNDDLTSERYLPEDTTATARLYRCIMRSCSHGRKTPPRAALDTVLAALPPTEESERSKALRKYLFSAEKEDFSLKELLSLLKKGTSWETRFSDMKDWDWGKVEEENEQKRSNDESAIVRRGISSLVAQGPLPTYQDGGIDSDIRAASAQAEEELSRKFFGIIDDLSYGNTADCEGWYKAAQCLAVKADLIADRLGLSTGFARNRNFYVRERKGLPEDSLAIAELLSEQEKEVRLKDEGWIRSLGKDLSPYVRYEWSSLDSLQTCSAEIGRAVHEHGEEPNDVFEAHAWREIENFYARKDLVGWQEAWGGLFVSSLRKTAVRCLSLAIYILHRRASDTASHRVLVSEIAESLGSTLYTELMGSQVYGYPMHRMPHMRKREVAEVALACFARAFQVADQPSEEGSDTDRITWDLLFMIGKCHEKIASTYQREKLQSSAIDKDGEEAKRMYERHMAKALQSYATSLEQAKEIERKGSILSEQHGGSSHGATEVQYRLHASRLKCLIAAVDRREEEIDLAELEALRLTERHWHAKPEETSKETANSVGVRDRVWNVLADVVAALAQCRLEHSYFHRSVYRHAQALMWAPVLCDPVGGRADGSLGTVPATRAFKLRGLNYSTNAASSGAVIIGSLFEKKRSQLCAVWVTATGSASAFQTINNSVRKYDSLRGKYISAYTDSLRLCHRRGDLETFLRWTSACVRDLPSYFAASALAGGGKPKNPHTSDCLLVKSRSLSSFHFLTTVKRLANSALAAVILHELNNTPSKDTKVLENNLKSAYACFLRLNCDPADLTKRKYLHGKSGGIKSVIEVLTTAYLRVSTDQPLSGQRSDWSGEGQIAEVLRAALTKCKELFPLLSRSFYSKKKATPKKKKKMDGKRKEPDGTYTVSKSFEVAVPDGLMQGDSFLTTVQACGQAKRVRLTVPAGQPATLRFSLRVPVEAEPEAKKSQTEQAEAGSNKEASATKDKEAATENDKEAATENDKEATEKEKEEATEKDHKEDTGTSPSKESGEGDNEPATKKVRTEDTGVTPMDS